MILYLVWGIEYHAARTLLGIYESSDLAYDRFYNVKSSNYDFPQYDDLVVKEYYLNEDIK